jgi:hypothetical protein
MAMDSTVTRWQITGFLFTSVVGTLLHFLFDFSGQRIAAALFSAVNESIWEHMKLLFYPMLLFAVLEYRFLNNPDKSFWCIKLRGILLGMTLIPVVYYSYTGILGIRVDWVNIAIFFLAAGVTFRQETLRLRDGCSCPVSPMLSVFLLCLIALLFTVFTFYPPHIPLFQDVPTGTYGF